MTTIEWRKITTAKARFEMNTHLVTEIERLRRAGFHAPSQVVMGLDSSRLPTLPNDRTEYLQKHVSDFYMGGREVLYLELDNIQLSQESYDLLRLLLQEYLVHYPIAIVNLIALYSKKVSLLPLYFSVDSRCLTDVPHEFALHPVMMKLFQEVKMIFIPSEECIDEWNRTFSPLHTNPNEVDSKIQMQRFVAFVSAITTHTVHPHIIVYEVD